MYGNTQSVDLNYRTLISLYVLATIDFYTVSWVSLMTLNGSSFVALSYYVENGFGTQKPP